MLIRKGQAQRAAPPGCKKKAGITRDGAQRRKMKSLTRDLSSAMLGVRAKSLGVCDKMELVGEGLFDLLNLVFY